MLIHNRFQIFLLSSLLLLAASIAWGVNQFYFHFPGGNYIPPGAFYIFFSLSLMEFGFNLLWGKNARITRIIRELILLTFLMLVVAIVTNAVQYTPFSPIDHHIANFENKLGFDMNAALTWTHHHPFLKTGLMLAYDSLSLQMALLPLLFILLNDTKPLHNYYYYLLMTVGIGFTFYYFFPTLAPASVLTSPYFSDFEKATGIKFLQIHQFIPPTTLEGGLIALPSFHVIWGLLCLYLVRSIKILYWILLPINILLIFACVLLGWHYLVDIIGALIVLLIGFKGPRSFGLAATCLFRKVGWTKRSVSTTTAYLKNPIEL